MRYYLLRQVLSAFPTILAVTLLIFLLMHMAPGDPAILLAAEDAPDEDIERLRERMGLNLPIIVQYIHFAGRLLQGDLGMSHFFGEPVIDRIRATLPATLELALVAAVFAVFIAVPIGVISALKRGTMADNASMTAALMGVSVPPFFLGILLIMLFSVALGWLPVAGRVSYGVGLGARGGFYLVPSLLRGDFAAFKDVLSHLLLPALTLCASPAAAWSRLIRSAMLEVIESDYIRTARAKGLHERTVIINHALRNSLIPVVTMMGVQLRFMLGGSIIVETIFGFSGMGRLLITGINCRDYFVVLGAVTVFALTAIVLNLLVDVSYGFIDPRLQYS